MPSRPRRLATAAALLLLTVSCEDSANRDDSAPPASSPATAGGSATAPPSAQAPDNPHAGHWRGSYSATRTTVTVPDGIRYPGWKQDDGKAYVGSGNIRITVAADGRIEGSARGALGEQRLSGRLDDDGLSAALIASADTADGGMTGVLAGHLRGGKIVAQLRVSDATGEVVREAKVALTRTGQE